MIDSLHHCTICPRQCGQNRYQTEGLCGATHRPLVARAALHLWEEPCISGTRGSGTIFFSGCNLSCLFCQNHQISAGGVGTMCDAQDLCRLFAKLEQQGAHNINLVTPTPHIATIREALSIAKSEGFPLPFVYNTNAYERVESLRILEGLVDIYLPDLKYVSSYLSERYSGAADYFLFAAPAIEEMFRQVGTLQLDDSGLAQKGLLIRHLVLPGSVDETRRVLDHIHTALPLETHIALMRQYTPAHRADFAPLNRPLTAREYERSLAYCMQLGFENVLIQGQSAVDASYTPPFSDHLE